MLYTWKLCNVIDQLYLNKFNVKKSNTWGSSRCGTVEMNLTSKHELTGSIPGLAQWVKDQSLL